MFSKCKLHSPIDIASLFYIRYENKLTSKWKAWNYKNCIFIIHIMHYSRARWEKSPWDGPFPLHGLLDTTPKAQTKTNKQLNQNNETRQTGPKSKPWLNKGLVNSMKRQSILSKQTSGIYTSHEDRASRRNPCNSPAIKQESQAKRGQRTQIFLQWHRPVCHSRCQGGWGRKIQVQGHCQGL